MKTPRNHGLYWSKEDMLRVKKLRDQGREFDEIAIIEGRTVSACVARYRMFGVLDLLQHGGPKDTLISMRKK